MNANTMPLDRQTWQRFQRHVKLLAHSEVGGQALGLFALLIAALLLINGLNVANRYVSRDVTTAIAERDGSGFIRFAFVWVGVFAAITVVSVISRYMEERLALLWRTFLARRVIRTVPWRAERQRCPDAVRSVSVQPGFGAGVRPGPPAGCPGPLRIALGFVRWTQAALPKITVARRPIVLP